MPSRTSRPKPERPLAPGDVAAIFGVSIETVAAWADDGKLPHFRTPSGQRRFRQADVDALIAATTVGASSEPDTAA